MRVLRTNMWRRDSATYSGQMRSDMVRIEAFVDRQKRSGEEKGNAVVAEGKEEVGTARLRRGSKQTPEDMRVVRGSIGERRKQGRSC